MEPIIIGSRGSDLALWQANFFQNALKNLGHQSRIEVIKTQGDRIQHLTFDKLEGKGFFTKELEDALLEGHIHVAVHSLKDLPTTPVSGLVIGGLSHRADARDMLLINPNSSFSQAKDFTQGTPSIGTSSARRKSQLKKLFPGCQCEDIRGNVPTRIEKLVSQNLDAIILAKAGLDRLEIDVSRYAPFAFDESELVPAPGQGVLAYQCTQDNSSMRDILHQLHHREIGYCTNIERGVLNALDGGCQLPLGVHVKTDSLGNYICHTSYADGQELKQFRISQSTSAGMKELILKKIDQ